MDKFNQQLIDTLMRSRNVSKLAIDKERESIKSSHALMSFTETNKAQLINDSYLWQELIAQEQRKKRRNCSAHNGLRIICNALLNLLI